MRCVERGSVIRALPQPGFPTLLGRRPDWDYETRRMVSNRILGPGLNQPLKDHRFPHLATGCALESVVRENLDGI